MRRMSHLEILQNYLPEHKEAWHKRNREQRMDYATYIKIFRAAVQAARLASVEDDTLDHGVRAVVDAVSQREDRHGRSTESEFRAEGTSEGGI